MKNVRLVPSFPRLTALVALALGAGAALAAEPYSQIDPNTFIVQPPASVRWTVRSANQEHPAVMVARTYRAKPVDANTFIVQPPAAVTWTVSPEPETTRIAQQR